MGGGEEKRKQGGVGMKQETEERVRDEGTGREETPRVGVRERAKRGGGKCSGDGKHDPRPILCWSCARQV